jgi:hypothetical protein
VFVICCILKSLISIFGQRQYKQLYMFSIKLGVQLLKGKQSRWIVDRAKAFNGVFWGVQMHFTSFVLKELRKKLDPTFVNMFLVGYNVLSKAY